MSATIRGVIEDLRRRRLLPVAVLLLAACVAVPLLGRQSAPATEPAPAPAPTAASTGGLPTPEQALSGSDKPLVSLAVLEGSSELGEFETKNPFKPVDQLAGGATDSPAGPSAGGTPAGQAPGSPSAGGGQPTGGTGTGSPGGGTQPQQPTGTPKPTDPPQQNGGDTPPKSEKKLTYAVDLTIRGPKGLRSYRGVPKLSLLPSQDNPLLVFLGVEDAGTKAVFLVDAELKSVSGEGTCLPSPAECATLTLEPGAQHTLGNDAGDTWIVTIVEVRETSVAKAASAARAAERRRARRARTADGTAASRRFVPPLITDLFTGGRS